MECFHCHFQTLLACSFRCLENKPGSMGKPCPGYDIQVSPSFPYTLNKLVLPFTDLSHIAVLGLTSQSCIERLVAMRILRFCLGSTEKMVIKVANK